jgi:hypothetical protein
MADSLLRAIIKKAPVLSKPLRAIPGNLPVFLEIGKRGLL